MPTTGVGAILDEEFLFLLSLLRPLFAITAPELRDQARLWLQRLCWVPASVDSARKDRNEYLSRLYYGMLAGKLDAVFREEPPAGALRAAAETFPLEDATAWLDDVAASRALEREDGVDAAGDADERTFLTTRVLPGGAGAFGYLAVSLAKGAPHWVRPNQQGDGQDAYGWKPQATSTPLDLGVNPAQRGNDLNDMLDSRPSAEQRLKLLDFYDSLINDIDRAEMEPDKPSPEIEKIISAYQDPTCPEPPPPRQREQLSQLRARLSARRERAARRSELLDSLEAASEHELNEMLVEDDDAPSLTGVENPDREDRDDVAYIRPENVALLQAAYPGELVRRFLDGVVRERVAVLGKVRARRYYQNNVQGVEEDAAQDMLRYRDATSAWAAALASVRDSSLSEAAGETASHAQICMDLAGKAAEAIGLVGAAREQSSALEAEMNATLERLRADVEVLRADEAALKRRLDGTLGWPRS